MEYVEPECRGYYEWAEEGHPDLRSHAVAQVGLSATLTLLLVKCLNGLS